jgi:phosphate:Na+ symporter
MSVFQAIIAIIATVMLFLHGLQGFSRELEALGRHKLRAWLGSATSNRAKGFTLGAAFTALVQSSSAVTALTVAMVDARVLSFIGGLAVMLGANVGTTSTAWLVSFKLTGLGAFMIIAGTVLSALPSQARVMGKSVFYFGLIFFSLDLIAQALGPFRDDPRLSGYLTLAAEPWRGILLGILATALLQSSSVVTGIAIVLVQKGVLEMSGAIAIIVGANIGTTVTSLIAGFSLGNAARRTALANLLFNIIGVLIFLPLVHPLSALVTALAGSPGTAAALAHLIFNLTVALLFLPLLGPVSRRLSAKEIFLSQDPKTQS